MPSLSCTLHASENRTLSFSKYIQWFPLPVFSFSFPWNILYPYCCLVIYKTTGLNESTSLCAPIAPKMSFITFSFTYICITKSSVKLTVLKAEKLTCSASFFSGTRYLINWININMLIYNWMSYIFKKHWSEYVYNS